MTTKNQQLIEKEDNVEIEEIPVVMIEYEEEELTQETLMKGILGDVTSEVTKAALRHANSITGKVLIGQRYSDAPVLNVDIGFGQNLVFTPSDTVLGGRPFIDLILDESNFDMPFTVINVEKSERLKNAMASETFEDDKPYTEGWKQLAQRLAVEHGNSKFPFAVLATDNGFSLLPKPLANIFVQLAQNHVEVVEYLKVLCQLSIGITPVKVLVSQDLYWKDTEDARAMNTDGMSLISQDVLTGLSIERNTGVQFRCISSEIIRSLREYDWSAFNTTWAEYFASAKVDAISTLIKKSVDWDSFGPEFADDASITEVFVPAPFSTKEAKAMMVEQFGSAEAKASWKVWDGLKKFSTKLKSWWNRNVPVVMQTSTWGYSPKVGVHLFSKGAALPAPRLWKQVKLVTEAETESAEGFDIPNISMVTPQANFKCLGKKAMAATIRTGGVVSHVVEMHMAVISQQSGGSMVTTPQCIEAGGSGLFKDMSESSLENWDKAQKIYGERLQAVFNQLGVSIDIKTAQPLEIQRTRALVNAKIWEAEELVDNAYPGDPCHLLATERGMESYFRKVAKEMASQMIQGRKRTTNQFRLLCMASFVEAGELAVPAFLEKSWEEDAVAQKQPIANTSNNTTVKLKFASKGSKVGNAIESMGLDRNVNCYFGSEVDCVLKWFADDDGDVLNVTFVNKVTGEEISFNIRIGKLPEEKLQALMNQMTSYFMATVKMDHLKPAAAELPKMPLSNEKARDWRDLSVPGVTPLDKYGLFIGSFVNQASLVSCAGHKFSLEQYGIGKVKFGISLSVHATMDNQGELDAPKHCKPTVPFMVVHFYKEWDEENGQWFVPESVINHLVPWCLMIRNGEDWDTFTMPDLNGQPGKVVINPNRYETKEVDGMKIISLDGVQVSQLEYDENLLWCNRDVLERLFDDTFGYVSWLQKMILPEGTTKDNFVTHYRGGQRFVSEKSLAEKTVKVGNGFVTSVSALAPVNEDMEAGLFASSSSLAGKSGFGVNLKTGKTSGPDYRYLGDETLVTVSHAIYLPALWRKLYKASGVNSFKCRLLIEREISNGRLKNSFYSLILGKVPVSKNLITKHVFGKEMSSFELFKAIYAPFVEDGGLEVMSKKDLIGLISKKSQFNWKKSNNAFGSESMVELCLAFAKHEILLKGEPASSEFLANLVINNLAKAEFARLGKDLWTMFLDYCLVPIQKRWELHSLPCDFAKVLAEINWKSLANKPEGTQGITIRAQALHAKFIGEDMSECRCCKSILTQGLKSLGRKEDTIKLESFKKDMADYLTATQFAFGKPVVQLPKGFMPKVDDGWVQGGRKVEAKDRVAFLQETGQWVSISDWNDGVPEFFGEFFTKSNVREDKGYGIQTVMKSVDGIVTDEDGATASDSHKFGIYHGCVLLLPSNSKEEARVFIEKCKTRDNSADGYGRVGVNVVYIDKPVETVVEISPVPPAAPQVIETPENDDIVEGYDEIHYNPAADPPDEFDY